jgi:hypothetical protein
VPSLATILSGKSNATNGMYAMDELVSPSFRLRGPNPWQNFFEGLAVGAPSLECQYINLAHHSYRICCNQVSWTKTNEHSVKNVDTSCARAVVDS